MLSIPIIYIQIQYTMNYTRLPTSDVVDPLDDTAPRTQNYSNPNQQYRNNIDNEKNVNPLYDVLNMKKLPRR